MLLKSINLKSLLFLLIMGFSVSNVTAQPNDGEENETGSPFGAPPIIKGDGDPSGNCCKSINPPGFIVKLANIKDAEGNEINEFPCLLYAGVTDQFGNTTYTELWPWDFEPFPIPTNSGLNNIPKDDEDETAYLHYYSYVSGTPLNGLQLGSIPCEQTCQDRYFRTLNYELELFCYDEYDDSYTPLEYCLDENGESEWEEFLSPFVGDAEKCSENPDENRLRGYLDYKMCCSDNNQVHQGPGVRPLVNENSHASITITPSLVSTEVAVSHSSNASLIMVTDISGHTLISEKIEINLPYNIDHTLLKTGIYFVTIITDNQVKTKKIIVN